MIIIVGGDLVPTESNEKLFVNGKVEELIGNDILDILNKSEINIFNLETPLVDREKPIMKCGPNLRAKISTINGIKKMKPTLIGLANNHILDQGIEGLESTIDVLKKNGINYIGVGKDLKKASKSYIIETEGYKVGVYACTETEFTIANENRAGANPFDPLESLDHIEELRKKSDYVIVLYHGGKEHYRYPSPYLQRVCHKIVEKGADVVLCQHSHCIGTIEEYNKKKIVYGQGNFLFDYSESEFWQTALLIKIEVGIDKEPKIDYIPICKEAYRIRLANTEEREEILKGMMERSREVDTAEKIKKLYYKFIEQQESEYLGNVLIYSKFLRGINRISKGRLIKIMCKKEKLLMLKNRIECEAHREILVESINKKLLKLENNEEINE